MNFLIKNDLDKSLIDKIDQIEKLFQCEVFLFSVENGEKNSSLMKKKKKTKQNRPSAVL